MWKFAKSFWLRLVNRPLKRYQVVVSKLTKICGEADSYSHIEQHVLDTKKSGKQLTPYIYFEKTIWETRKPSNVQKRRKENDDFFLLFYFSYSNSNLPPFVYYVFFPKTKHLAHDWLCGGSNLFQVYRPIGYGLLVSVRLAWGQLIFLSEFFFSLKSK